MLKRGLSNKVPYTFIGYYLVNDHNEVRLVKQYLDAMAQNSFLYLYAFLTWHKSFNFAVFCC